MKDIPPGADPFIQGYWAYVDGREREAPSWSPLQDYDWQKRWYKGYDEARRKDERD